MEKEKKFGLTGNQLKIIAMLAMLCDHAGRAFCYDVVWLRAVGRIAFPIFAYMIAEGCIYTKNRRRHLLLMLSLGLACQAVYFIFMKSLYLNILLTFSLSLITVYAIDLFLERKDFWSASLAILVMAAVVTAGEILPNYIGFHFRIDYGTFGVFTPVFLYYLPKKPAKLFALAVMLVGIASRSSEPGMFSFLALPLLALYNGERGKYKLKYLFYIFYPSHLAVIYLIGLLLK